jgi:hypothetical protein
MKHPAWWLAAAALAACAGPDQQAQEQPPLPYEAWGACPFECCTYRRWQARHEIAVHQNRSEHSPVLFRVRPDEWVDALTGVVVTTAAMPVTFTQAVEIGYLPDDHRPQLALPAGATVWALHPQGEGSYLIWYRGRVYASGAGTAPAAFLAAARAQPLRYQWWKQVRNQAGTTGWTLDGGWRNADRCG